MFWHRLVKRSVKRTGLRHAGHRLFCSFYTRYVRWIVQWREVNAVSQRLFGFLRQ
jgi:hypothetical protein